MKICFKRYKKYNIERALDYETTFRINQKRKKTTDKIEKIIIILYLRGVYLIYNIMLAENSNGKILKFILTSLEM